VKFRGTVSLGGKPATGMEVPAEVVAIEDAKTPETRQGRIEKAVSSLRDGRK